MEVVAEGVPGSFFTLAASLCGSWECIALNGFGVGRSTTLPEIYQVIISTNHDVQRGLASSNQIFVSLHIANFLRENMDRRRRG